MLLDTSAGSAGLPSEWIAPLYVYGPVAASVFCLLLMEPRARGQFGNQAIPRPLTILIYAATWAVVIGCLLYGQLAWRQMNLPVESAIIGSFENLRNEETITSRSVDLYLRRVYGSQNNLDYVFRIISGAKLAEGSKISFYFDPGDPNQEATRHELTVHSSYYKENVKIVYHRATKLLDVQSGSTHESLPVLQDDVLGEPKPTPNGLFDLAVAFAQADTSVSGLVRDLNSPDPIVRRDARRGLSTKSSEAVPNLDRILVDKSSNYRQRLGAVVALSGMEKATLSGLSTQARLTLEQAAADPDKTLSDAARKVMDKHPELKPAVRRGVVK